MMRKKWMVWGLITLFAPVVIQAQTTNTWSTTVATDYWDTSSNWSLGGAPDATQVANLNGTLATPQWLRVTNAVTAGSLVWNMANANGGLAIDTGGSLTLALGGAVKEGGTGSLSITQTNAAMADQLLSAAAQVDVRQLLVRGSTQAEMAYFTIGDGLTVSTIDGAGVSLGNANLGRCGTLTLATGGTLKSSGNILMGYAATNSVVNFILDGGTVSLRGGQTVGLSKAANAVATVLWNDGVISNSQSTGASYIKGVSATDMLEVQLASNGTHTVSLNAATSTLVVENTARFVDQAGQAGTLNIDQGIVELYTNNTFTGGLTIGGAGKLKLVTGGGSLAEILPMYIGGTLDLDGNSHSNSSVIVFQGGTVSNGTIHKAGADYDGRAGAVSAVLTGDVGLTKSTGGTLALSGANTYTGDTTVQAGALRVGNDSAVGTGHLTLEDGARLTSTLNSTTRITLTNDVTLHGDVTLGEEGFAGALALSGNMDLGDEDRVITTINSESSSNYSANLNGVISGTGGIVKEGSGFMILNGTANTFSGDVTLNNGTLIVRSNNSLGGTGKTLFLNGGALANIGTMMLTLANPMVAGGDFSLKAANTVTLNGSLDLGGAVRTITSAGTSASILNGGISNGGLIVNTSGESAGSITLGGTNTYAGNTTIQAGTLALGATGSISNSATITVAAGATLDLSPKGMEGYALANGQVLNGSGTVNGGLIVGDGAILAPGNSPGTLGVENLTWTGGGILDWEVATNSAAGAAGTDWDFLNVTGSFVNQATAGDKFTINIKAWNGFASDIDETWTILTANDVNGFSADAFLLNDQTASGGTWSITADAQNLYLTHAIPEPAVVSLMALAGAAMLLRRRMRQNAA